MACYNPSLRPQREKKELPLGVTSRQECMGKFVLRLAEKQFLLQECVQFQCSEFMMDVHNLERGQRKAMGTLKTWKVSRSSIYSAYHRDDSRIAHHSTQKQDERQRALQSSSRRSDKLLCQTGEAKNSTRTQHFVLLKHVFN